MVDQELTPDRFMSAQKERGASTDLTPDSFMRMATAPPPVAAPPPSLVPSPEDVDRMTATHAQAVADAITRPAPVPGMERLGGVPPGPAPTPALPVPWETRLQTELQPEQTPGMITGKMQTDIPNVIMNSVQRGAGRVASGVEQMAEPGGRTKAGGLHEAIGGGFELATPTMMGAGAAAPIKTGLTVAAAIAAQHSVTLGLKYLGLPAEYADVAGDLTGIIAGAVAHGKISKAAIRETVEPILKERAAQKAAPPEQQYTITGQPIRGELTPDTFMEQGSTAKTERTENVTQPEPQRRAEPQAESAAAAGREPDAGPRIVGGRPAAGPGDAGIEPARPEAGREADEAARPVAPELPNPAGNIPENIPEPANPVSRETKPPTPPQRAEAPVASSMGAKQETASPRPDGARPLAAEQIPLEPKKGAAAEFMEDESGNSMVASVFRADLAEARVLVAKRNAALEQLRKAEAAPEEKRFGQRVLEHYTAERDTWGARVNQVMERLRKLVPDHVEQEALSLMRDFKNRPGELRQFAMGTHPDLGKMEPDDYRAAMENIAKLQPAIDRALNPTPRMQAADAVLTQIAGATLKEGQAYGFLDSSITPDEYVTHLLHPKDQPEFATPLTERMGKAMGGKIGRQFAFSQKRNYPTLLHAVADNVKPRTLNAFDAFTIHGDKFATARATHELVDALKRQGVGKWGTKGSERIPDGWVEIAPHAHPFQNLVKFTDAEGSPQVARQTLFVPKVVEEALRPITDPDYTSKIAGFTRARVFQSYTKAVQLGLSFFHATTENYMALANMGPKGWLRGIRADRDTPEFLQAEREFIAHGGTSPVQGRTYEAYKSLQPGSIPTWGDIWKKAPGVAMMDRAAESITRFTFDKLQRQFKVTDFSLHKAAWLAKHPDATVADEIAAYSSIAKEINAVYGGLHWENLGVNRTTLETTRAIMLAPDWTLSNVFNLKYAVERGTPAGQLARAFWIRQIAGGLAATQAMSLMLGHHLSKKPTQVYMGQDREGLEIYQNVFFKGAPGDVVNLINNVDEYGAVLGLTKSMAGKAAPIPRTAMQLMMNRNYLGQEIIPKGMSPIAATVRGAYEIGKGLAPIPLSLVNIKDMLVGPHAGRYTVPEVLTMPFAGTPPRHTPPEGMRMTKKGLQPSHEKPRRSVLDEITSGKR